jgi:predicted nucleic acid-binding protein
LKTIFVDSLYWIGLTNPKDQWHQKVVDVQKSLHKVNLITTELVLVEFLNYKGYSMVDCISMQVMRSRNLTEVLTHDKHFSQEGFILLL